MKIDYSPRQSGRTTRMIELLANDERRILLTFSKREETRLRDAYPKVSNRIIFWEDYIKQKRGRKELESQKIIIDNADYILEQVVGDWVEIGTFTVEKIDIRTDKL